LDDFEIVKVRDDIAYGKKAGSDVRKGREYMAVGFGDATTKYFHCTREGFLSNPKEKYGVKSLDVDISEHSKVRDDDQLVGVFWADEEAIRNYSTFGDIVSFDATFRSNKYQMVFLSFTKINHHNRCITFASGFLADETARAYIWLLKEFKEAFGKDPEVVVTDQDPSMKIAIAECFPDTCTHYKLEVFTMTQQDLNCNAIEAFTNSSIFYRLAQHYVKFCKSEMKLHCRCNRCEAYGLLCSHTFYVLRMNNVKEFPKNYLHKRWLKNVKPLSFDRRRITGASNVVQSEVLELYKIFESSIDRLVHDLDKFHIYKDKMKELPNQAEINVPMVLKVNSKDVISAMLGVNEPKKVLIGNPNLSKVKGTGCFLRMKPVVEVIAKELANRRICGLCGGKEGHNKRTCTNEPTSKKPKVQDAPKEKAAPKQ
nr:FAR1 DNA binding domain, zinc finger, SWIM-type, MULE transposase domain, FHY3/FAR1 family [Tanacetum cinerariifolium]